MQNGRRVFGMVLVLIAAASLVWGQSTIPIFPTAASPQAIGADFDVEIKVGNSTNPVSNLFGLSFELNYTNTNFVDVVGAPVQGDFLGNDILFFPNVDDANGKVSVGMTRKGGGGVNGDGTVMKVKFKTLATTPNGTQVQFTITNVSANDPNGAAIVLTPAPLLTVVIGTVVVCPSVSAINPASGPAGTAVTITGTDLNDVTAVKFANNAAATFTITSATQISTTVPNGAVTGPITLSKTGCADVQTGVFTVLLPRFVRVASATASVGNIVMVPIELDALGDENALGLSLTFDPTILSNPQAALGRDAGSANLITNASQAVSGRYGLAIALPAGQKFAAGTREIVVVSFAVNATTKATSATIAFGDQPIPRDVVDANAGSLPVTWIPGTITIIAGYEGDVAPRPNGNNGAIKIEDWVQLGRFVARLDTPSTEPNEFQRADCAPKTCGDGRLGISDWVQAGRYAASLDPIVTACGPMTPSSGIAAAVGSSSAAARTVRAVNATFERGQSSVLSVELDAQGDENALGFSLNFDASLLVFQNAAARGGAVGETLIVNSSEAAKGRVGIAMALPVGQQLVAGTQQILAVTFFVNRNTLPTTTQVRLENQPVLGEISNVNAENLAVAWTAATVTITFPTSVSEIAAEKIPTEFALEQNYPNPFLSGAKSRAGGNPSTNIAFSLPKPSHVTLKVFTVLGEEVATLVEQEFSAGRYEATWDARSMNGGVYFYRLQAGSFVQTKKLILMK